MEQSTHSSRSAFALGTSPTAPNPPFENQSSMVLRLALLVQEARADPMYDPGGPLFRIGE
jgi:hypothetical protein